MRATTLGISVLLFAIPALGQPGSSAQAAPQAPALLKGSLEPRKEATWTLTVKAGKEARVRVLKGQREVSFDVLDAQGLAANEGVSEGDWFPVSPGAYTVIVTNATALGAKAVGRTVAYALKVEVR